MDDTPEVQLEARSFVWTIKNGDLDALAEFLKSKKFNVNTLVEGRFPIHYAADYGQYDLIKFLLSNGAKVNELDRHGISPLLAAIWEGHTECVKLLLAHGADPTGRTPDGRSFLEVAETREIQNILQQHG